MTMARIIGTALCGTILAACVNDGGAIYRKDTFGPYNVMSLDARQRLVLQGSKIDENGVEHPVICSEPSPDAIAAQAAQLAASANVQSGVNQSAGAQLAGGFSESVASIALRTQTIQLLRDGYFRLCEAYLNGAIDRDDYRHITLFIDEFIATVVAIESIGGTVQTAPVAINTSMSSILNKEGVQLGGPTTLPAQFPGQITVNSANASEVAAQQIRQILFTYYERKRKYQEAVGQIAAKPLVQQN